MSSKSKRTNADKIVRELISSRPGPFEAIVVSHMDPKYMGSLKVDLLRKNSANSQPERVGTTIDVRYLSPFYGVTNYDHATPNDGYENTQKSYGFWAVPPDPGTRVLVIFAENDISRGYWIGCIQDEYMNFMVPDGRASTTLTTNGTPNNLKGKKLPTGEYNKTTETGEARDPTVFRKPYNKDFTEILEVQGLLDDEFRGTTTTSARREVPSAVYGWSTPGPVDKRQTAPTGDYGEVNHKSNVFVNRLGGSSFVMDDGDDKYLRASHAADGPPYYVNKERGEAGGDETIPQNEAIRIRTRTGHQILLHNSEDLMYIGNSRGTAWIELTSDGKIDVYAEDSISMYTEQDFNFVSNRDINLDAGRNINIVASARWSDDQNNLGYDSARSGEITIQGRYATRFTGGNDSTTIDLSERTIDISVEDDIKFQTSKGIEFLADRDIKFTAKGTIHTVAYESINTKANQRIILESTDFYNQVSNNLNVVVGSNSNETVGANKNLVVEGSNKITVAANTHIHTSGDSYTLTDSNHYTESGSATYNTVGTNIYNDVAGNFNIQAGAFFSADASNVYLNSELSNPGLPASGPIIDATQASAGALGGSPQEASESYHPEKLKTFTLPRIISGETMPTEIQTIATRVPQHEPWPHHENLDPVAFKPENLDRERADTTITPAERVLTPDTFLKNKVGIERSTFVPGSGGSAATYGTPNYTGGNYSNKGTGIIVPPLDRTSGPDDGSRGNYPESSGDPVPMLRRPASLNMCLSGDPILPSGKEFGSTGGAYSEIQNRVAGTRKGDLQQELRDILVNAARYARLDVIVRSGGQPVHGPDRIGSVRHNLGWAADFRLQDSDGNNLSVINPQHLGRIVTFIRAFRDFARQAGHKPSVGAGPGYMGGNTIHADIAHDKPGSLTSNFTSSYGIYCWGRSTTFDNTPCWLLDIMHGGGSRDGYVDPNTGRFNGGVNAPIG